MRRAAFVCVIHVEVMTFSSLHRQLVSLAYPYAHPAQPSISGVEIQVRFALVCFDTKTYD
jgi:hypothetical protein